MEDNKYTRGSEWRKWDLHVHSLKTHLSNNYSDINEDALIKKLQESEIRVVGLTNYFNFTKEDYELKKKLEQQGIIVFLNLELRLTYKNKEDQCCDIHIIFNNKLENIDCFLSNLTIKINGQSKKANTLSSQDDFVNGTVEFDHLVETLEDESLNLKNNYLIGFLSRGHGNGRTSTQYEQLAKKCGFLIHSSDSEQNISEDRIFWLSQGKPLLQSSDAHSIEQIGKKYTWIKADPTFEGLKQILYEPEDRVRIQKTDPALDFEKSPLTEINISENIEVFNEESDNVSFKACTLPLNNNLVSIIGGRGTGKSLLIDYISHFLGRNSTNDNYRGSSNLIVKRKTSLAEDEKSFALDSVQEQFPFIYIPQSEVKEIVKDADKFSESILSTIGINKEYSPDETLTDNIRQNLINYTTLYNELNKDNTSAQAKKENIDNQIKNNQNLISNITSEENKERLQSYKGQLEKLSKMNSLIDKLSTLSKTLQEFQKQVNTEIESLNEDEEIKNSTIAISPISLDSSSVDIKKVITYFEEQKGRVDSEIQKTKEQFSGYKGDLASLLDNVKTYQERVEELKQEKSHIETKEKQLEECKNKFSEYGNGIEQSLNDYKVNIEGVWQQFKNGKEGFDDKQKKLLNKIIGAEKSKIEVEIQIDFDSNKLYENILDKLDKRSWKRQYLEQQLKINDFPSYIDCIKNANIRIFDNINFNDIQNEVLKTLFTDFTQYVRHKPIVKSDGKDIKKLSHGQRGTTYLRLKLASNLLSQTIIYDQPEDDLDNEFIISELVDIFKEIKKYRQVIIVSHNANLVVNADSEQIIVAKNENGVLSYYSGSLEDPSINSDICRVLEGGQEAFQKRENKYGFKQ